MKKNIKLIIGIIILSSLSLLYASGMHKYDDDHDDYVPDKETAIKIAEAVWFPIYGKDIYSEKPYVATLDTTGKIWTVRGSLPANSSGGVAWIKIQKHDCKVLDVYHEK